VLWAMTCEIKNCYAFSKWCASVQCDGLRIAAMKTLKRNMVTGTRGSNPGGGIHFPLLVKLIILLHPMPRIRTRGAVLHSTIRSYGVLN